MFSGFLLASQAVCRILDLTDSSRQKFLHVFHWSGVFIQLRASGLIADHQGHSIRKHLHSRIYTSTFKGKSCIRFQNIYIQEFALLPLKGKSCTRFGHIYIQEFTLLPSKVRVVFDSKTFTFRNLHCYH